MKLERVGPGEATEIVRRGKRWAGECYLTPTEKKRLRKRIQSKLTPGRVVDMDLCENLLSENEMLDEVVDIAAGRLGNALWVGGHHLDVLTQLHRELETARGIIAILERRLARAEQRAEEELVR